MEKKLASTAVIIATRKPKELPEKIPNYLSRMTEQEKKELNEYVKNRRVF